MFRNDAAPKADVAIVVGSPDAEHLRHRISAGVSLITSKRVARLILCGGGREKDPAKRSEAERMQEIALKAGVAADRVILEDSAHDLADTAKECARLLKSDSQLAGTRSVILVSSAWHLLRLSVVMRRHLPHGVALTCFPATEGLTASNWQTTPQGRAVVDNELRLIEKLLKTGYSLR